MFKALSTPCVTTPRLVGEQWGMAKMHPSMQRLYAAAARLPQPIRQQAELAKRLNTSSQVINNWEARGISLKGANKVQAQLGISSTWILSDEGPEVAPASQSMGLDVEKLADLLETVEDAIAMSRRQVPARTKARVVAALYADERVSAAGSAEAVSAVLAGILATLEEA